MKNDTDNGVGAININLVYPKPELMRLMGWAEPAWAAALDQGLVVHKAGRRIWIEGVEVVNYLRRQGKQDGNSTLPEPGTVEKRTTPAPADYVSCRVVSSAQRDFDGDRVWLMELQQPTGEIIKWRCPSDNGRITAIARKSLGLLGDVDPAAAEGRTAVVQLGEFVGRDGVPRPCVTRWQLPPKPAEDAPQPADETDELPLHQQAAEQPAKPRRTAAKRALETFEAATDAAGDDGDIPF